MHTHANSERRREFRRALDEAVAAAQRQGRIQWLAARLRVTTAGRPEDLLREAFVAWRGGDCFYWDQPDEEFGFVAQGALYAIEPRGPDRFLEASRLAQSLYEDVRIVGSAAPSRVGPLLVGGFAFAESPPEGFAGALVQAHEWREFPNARLVLPEQMLSISGGACWWTVVHPVVPGARADAEWKSLVARLESGPIASAAVRSSGGTSICAGDDAVGPEYRVRSDRSHARFHSQVRDAVGEIEAEQLEKVVLARSLSVRHDGEFFLPDFLAKLRRIYPSCTTFAIEREHSAFIGATPECLVTRRGEHVQSTALAGSAPRGRTPAEDARLGQSLLDDPKELLEHALVVRAIQQGLAPWCQSLDRPAQPRLRRVEGIQHLETPIAGDLREGAAKSATVLDLVAALHPTPAVAGVPRERALDWIHRTEELDRGWYAAPVGYVDCSGGGDFRVALRSGLIAGGNARLFAGAGLVAGSQPESELDETRLKLRALLAPLTDI